MNPVHDDPRVALQSINARMMTAYTYSESLDDALASVLSDLMKNQDKHPKFTEIGYDLLRRQTNGRIKVVTQLQDILVAYMNKGF